MVAVVLQFTVVAMVVDNLNQLKESNQDIEFPKIRSITPACQKRGSPSWLVIVIVVAVVLIVLVLALVGIKYYRSRFNRLPQDDPES